jgi:hypothetical protein
VALARSGWSHVAMMREALLAPAVSGVVAMPGLFSLTNSKRTPAIRPTTTQREAITPPATSALAGVPEDIAAPVGWAYPAGSVPPAHLEPDRALPEPQPKTPVPPAYATWPGMSPAQPATAPPGLTWPATTASSTLTPASAQTWPDAPATPSSAPASTPFPTWPTEPVRDNESTWQSAPPQSAPPAWHDPWVAADAGATPPPPRLIERDIRLIGTNRTDPDYPQWDQLEVAASTWLERRASDLGAADSAL